MGPSVSTTTNGKSCMELANDGDDEDVSGDIVNTGVESSCVKILSGVIGVEECCNDVIVSYGEGISRHVILFPGDVQDYEEKMCAHRDNHVWKEYNLTCTARVIQQRFPHACVWVVRAHKLHLNTFACYKNFVSSNSFGVPTYSKESVQALLHCACLMENCVKREFGEEIRKEISDKPINIIGFSKGCMVLNQMMHEWPLLSSPTLSTASYDNTTLRYFKTRLKDFYWLDAGNCGHSGAWVTDESCLIEALKDIRFRVHVTPYQVRDAFRPWIGEELKVFREHLERNGADLKVCSHFDDEEASLQNHFRLLFNFRKKVEDG